MVHKNTLRAGRKKFFFILGTLLLVNAGVAHILIDQIAIRTSAQTQVLSHGAVAEEGELVSGDAHNPVEDESKPTITTYVVQSGDTISGIAEKFHISTNTIRWANDLDKNATIKVGQKLEILPITGVKYTIKSGDTLSGIAKKYKVDADEILYFNDLEDANELKPGVVLIIPGAQHIEPPKPAPKPKSSSSSSSKSSASQSSGAKTTSSSSKGEYANPVPGAVLTQGFHAVNAVDFGARTGTPVYAVKGGTVVVAKDNGAYNGGFGNFVVVDHGGGFKTLYAHLSKVTVSVGDSLDQGEQLGKVGNTGRSTGPHLHLEFHGKTNPWTKDKKGTRY